MLALFDIPFMLLILKTEYFLLDTFLFCNILLNEIRYAKEKKNQVWKRAFHPTNHFCICTLFSMGKKCVFLFNFLFSSTLGWFCKNSLCNNNFSCFLNSFKCLHFQIKLILSPSSTLIMMILSRNK